jgi:arylsulfatase A-like enzyme
MTTRKYLCLLTLWLCFTLSFALQSLSATEQTNVVFILIDDLSHYGVSAYGATELNSTQVDTNGDPFFETAPVATPQIDSLASEGLLAGNAFAYAICEPTRIALMTGMNNNRDFIQPKALHESQITFGDIFKQAGYVTGIAGKWKQSRGTAVISGKDYVDQFGWDEIYCFDLIGEGSRHIDPNFVINGVVTYFKKVNGGIDPLTGRRWYGPDLINRFALSFIEQHQNEPFFLYYPMLLVHDEHTPTPDTEPKSLFDNWQAGYAPVPADNEYGAFKGDDRRFYPDMVTYMDKMIGKVTAQLNRLGLREKTLIIVMGDNGSKAAFSYTLEDGSEFIGAKGQCKVNGLQVPLILSYPGSIAAGTSYNGLINLTDLLPTLCEATGIDIPNQEDLDGISFWPQATGSQTKAHREHLYTWYNANRAMTDQSKRITYAQEIGFKRYGPDANYPEGRFFDLRADPFERAGANKIKFDWNNWHHSGLDIAKLTEAQRAVYNRLGAVLVKNAYRPVSAVKIVTPTTRLKVNESIALQKLISPKDATMRSVIWESSDPAIAMVDKFGIVTARQLGNVTISLYSWDDERPVADGKEATLKRTGLSDQINLIVIR